MGRSHLAPEVFNCNAPDTGNMETILRYGTEEQKERWLKPLLAGEIRSAFALTEGPTSASSESGTRMSRAPSTREGDEYVINGRKWYTTGATDPRCKIIIFMGETAPESPERHQRQSMILVARISPVHVHAIAAMCRALPVRTDLGGHLRLVRLPATEHPPRRSAGSRSRKGALGQGVSTIACG